MRWIGFLGVLTPCLTGLVIIGCSRQEPASGGAPPQPVAEPARPVAAVSASVAVAPGGDGIIRNADFLEARAPELSAEEKYNAALLEALNLTADRKYDQALTVLQGAQNLKDTEQIRAEISRLQGLIDQQTAAGHTVQDIQTVLNDGQAPEASRLAAAALQQYGGTDLAGPLADLKRQADALTATQIPDAGARRTRFRQDGEAALRDGNLRAAALAFEQALQEEDDPDLRRQLDDLHATLSRYDDNRRRAADLRRDPGNLEDAVAALQDADKAWDTAEVRQEIDECNLALQKRRDRIAVADFEVRADVGIPQAGRTIAEELLPAFRPRFDLVERGQLGKVIEELKLDAGDLADNDAGRSEVGRLAKVRYLVLGSVSSLGGITVNARLIEVRTGLVVQTAKIVAASPEELLPRLPTLANLLMMTDAERMAYEQQLAAQAAPPPVVQAVNAPLPPPPDLPPAAQPLPPPVVVYCPRPPDVGTITVQDFVALPPPSQPPSLAVVVAQDEPIRQRMMQVAVQLGDNFFLRGNFQEAHHQFELALNLSPDREELRVRVERCKPHLPPPPSLPVAAPPVVAVGVAPPAPAVVMVPVARPRVAVLNFVVNADASVAPPGFGDWAADQMASYFAPSYEVIDRGQLFWYMGRLGLSVRDVLTNAYARRCLGQALQARFFVFGVIQQTGSFTVTTHMVDSETGARQAGGNIHVQDHQELKLRMGELAKQTRQTQADPNETARLQQDARESEQQVNTARKLVQQGNYAQAIDVCSTGLKAHPDNVALRTLLEQAQQKQRDSEAAAARKRELEQRQAEIVAAQKRQQELARQAEAARQKAAQEAAARGEAARQAQEAQRRHAHDELLARAQQASQQGNYQQSIQLLQSAAALEPNDQAGKQALLAARAKAEEQAKAKKAQEEQARRAAEQRRQEAELARSRQQVAQERLRHEAELQAQRQAQEERDTAAYNKLLGDGRRLLSQGKYADALASLQGAQGIRRTPEVAQLVQQARDQEAQTLAQQKSAGERAEMERRQAAEKAAAQAEADKRKKAEEQAKAANLRRLLNDARTALNAGQFDRAAQAYAEADQLAPGNAEVQAGLARIQSARAHVAAEAHPHPEAVKTSPAPMPPMVTEAQRKAEAFQKLLNEGRAALAGKQYDAAIKDFQEAQSLSPTDPSVAALIQQTQKARSADQAAMEAQFQKKREEKQLQDYNRYMAQGRAALAGRRWDEAVHAFQQALQIQ
ncbi:MAG: hypothetical protein JO112_06200, partial [Planctomycetes bacterium]|nr:hypothetical protein [Planctomycetota bacterium]